MSYLSFQKFTNILIFIPNLQKFILDNLWNAWSDSQKLEALNVLSFHFKQTNDNLESFSNPSNFGMHYIPMDKDLESFNCRKQKKISEEELTTTFSNFFSKWISKTF